MKNKLLKLIKILFITALFTNIFWLKPNIVFAGQGCCSWHDGQNYCDYDIGRWVCNDNTYSPSCGCPIIKWPTCNVSISPSEITWGENAVLSWDSSYYANSVNNSNFGTSSLNGTKSINPVVDMTYNLIVRNIRGTGSCQASIKVNPKVEVKNRTVIEPIKLDDEVIKDNSLPKWKEIITDSGIVGSKEIIYADTYTNDVFTKTDKNSENIKIEPRKKIIREGTKNPIVYYLLSLKNAVISHKIVYLIGFVIIIIVVVVFMKRKAIKKFIRKRK